jgi:hypothetical protein
MRQAPADCDFALFTFFLISCGCCVKDDGYNSNLRHKIPATLRWRLKRHHDIIAQKSSPTGHIYEFL